MNDMSGYAHATKVLKKISNSEEKNKCLRALKHAQNGQQKLSEGDFRSALSFLHQAHDGFQEIPIAQYLLGIVKADLAAAYGNLSEFPKAIKFAEESIAIIYEVDEFSLTEAMAHMTLGSSYCMMGDSQRGANHFNKARQILNQMPNTDEYIKILETNEKILKKRAKKWWQFWK